VAHIAKASPHTGAGWLFPGYQIRPDRLKGGFVLYPSGRATPPAKKPAKGRLQARLLETLLGIGNLHSSTGDVSKVRYHLPVFQTHGTQAGEGLITGNREALRDTFMDSEHILEIADGRRLAILLTGLKLGSATFRTTGPIPGF